MSGLRVLVCGGRDFNDYGLLCRTLDHHHKQRPITSIITGGARGADALAIKWAFSRGIRDFHVFSADWKKHGKGAGPIRNQQMLDEGKPDMVMAFPGGRGTADMVRRAQAEGVTVMELL